MGDYTLRFLNMLFQIEGCEGEFLLVSETSRDWIAGNGLTKANRKMRVIHVTLAMV